MIFLWWMSGVLLALAARWLIGDDLAHGIKAEPLTWGGLIMCSVVGVVGPFLVPFVVIASGCWLSDYMKLGKILGRRVFQKPNANNT